METSKEEFSDSLTNMSDEQKTHLLEKLEKEVAFLKQEFNDVYEAGWNSAMEMAAFRVEHDFKKAFGQDTLSSIAIYIKGLKK